MNEGQSAVTYEGLPISSGGAHKLGRTSTRKAVESWRDFLAACTRPGPPRAYFSVASIPGLEPAPETVDRIAGRFEPSAHVPGRFEVPPGRVDEAVELYESLSPQPVNEYGISPVWLTIAADITLLRPGTPDPWPDQDPVRFGHFVTPGGIRLGASDTKLILGGRASLGLSLSFPEATDDDFAALVPWLQSALPMKLSPKHWTRWTRTKSSTSYRSRKLSVTSRG